MRICTLGFWVGLELIKAFEVWRWKACISVSCQEDMGFLGSETELYSIQVPLENRYWMKLAPLHQEPFSENRACTWLVNNYATNLSQMIGLSEGAYVWGTCHHGQTDATPAGDDLQGWPAGMTKWPLGWVWSPHLSIPLMRHKALGFPVLSNSSLYKQTPTEFTHYNCVACSLLLQQQKMVLDSHTLETLVISKWSWLFFSTEKSVHSVLISILWTLCSGSRQRLPRVVSLSETEADQ